MTRSMFTTPEVEARRALSLQGYRIHDGSVWYITNDDTERGVEEVRIGDAEGTAEDTYWMLSNHHWPTTGPVLCQLCQDAEGDLDGYCQSCTKIIADELRGEAEREGAEEALDRWDRDRT